MVFSTSALISPRTQKKMLGANLISVHNIMQTLEFLTDFAYTEYIS